MYAVEIKPSARRINGPAGEYLARRGPVRVQDAAPNDPADADGYLVADPARDRSGGARRRASRSETTLGEFG